MITMSSIERGVLRALATGALAALAAGALPAQAQQQPAQQQASGEPALQEVVVTGSLIKRTDFETPSPIQVMTADDLLQSGYTSVSEVLHNLAANGQGTLSQSFGLAFAGGGSGIALRGLTVGGTLTLVDSERMIPYPLSDDGQRNFVDISSIPFGVIDHIDVLKDGASAAYGSDAVAGVVNVVLKKNFQGVTATAEGGSSQHGDGTTEHFSILAGTGDLASDGYNAYLALEFRHQDPILLANRTGDWTNLNWTGFGGLDTRPGAALPAAFAPWPGILGGYEANLANGTFTPFNTAYCASQAAYNADQCLYKSPFQIQPQTGNLNVLGRLTKTLGSDWQAVVTGSLFRSESQQVQNYPGLVGVGGTQNVGQPITGVAYGPGFLPFLVTTPPILLPNGDAVGGLFPQMGAAETEFVTNTYRFFTDLKGTAAGWDIDATAGWMYAALEQKLYGSIDPGEMATAAANGFDFATATGAQMDAAFAPYATTKDTNTMQVLDLHGARQLFQLPGGPLSLAVGAGGYHLYKNSPAPTTVSEALQFGNGAFAIGGQTDYNAYAEFVAPVFQGFELDVAGRYDHYNEYGSSTTPKLGLKYTPFDMLTLRGTYGKGFRAPNPAESGNAQALFFGAPFVDPILCVGGNPMLAGNFPSQCNATPPGLGVSTPTLKPEKSTNYTFGFIFQPWRNTNISLDYWDIKVTQDIQSGTNIFFLSGFTEGAGTPVRGPSIVLPECTATVTTGNCPTANVLTPVGPYAYTPFPYFNLTETHVNGLDLDLHSAFDMDKAGKLTTSLNGTYIFHYIFGLAGSEYDLAGTHGPSIISGDTGNPKIRATASLAWDIGPWDATMSMNYVGRFNLTDPTNGEPTCEAAIQLGGAATRFLSAPTGGYQQYCEVAHFTDFDLYLRYAVSKNLAVHASVLDLFNSQPPVDITTYGASGNPPYNPAMAQAGAIGRFFLLGATYTW